MTTKTKAPELDSPTQSHHTSHERNQHSKRNSRSGRCPYMKGCCFPSHCPVHEATYGPEHAAIEALMKAPHGGRRRR